MLGRIGVALCLMVALAGSAGAAERQVPDSAPQMQLSFAPIVKRVAPAVVNVYATRTIRQFVSPLFSDPFFRQLFGDPFGGSPSQRRESSLGSGVIIDASGLVVTNFHVIAQADEVKVALSDKHEFSADIVLKDERSDLAVLRIKGAPADLPTLQFADSDSVQVGDLVLAIGDPFGVGQTVTSGIVSAFARLPGAASQDQYFIQTDAAINPGNSGGALVDTSGNLLGINTAIYSRTGGSLGIGFAIPVSTARQVMEGLIKNGQVTRGWIGVEPRDLTPEIAKTLDLSVTQGVLITGVVQSGPASAGGLRPGDVVLKIGATAVTNTPQLLNAVAALKPRETATISVQRGHDALDIKVLVAQRPRSQPAELTR